VSTVHVERPVDNAPVRRTAIERVTAALQSNNIDVGVVDIGEEARRLVLELVPEGTEVHSGKSKTLEDLGLYRELFESGRYESVRARYLRMDRKTQGRENSEADGGTGYMLGSVHAVSQRVDGFRRLLYATSFPKETTAQVEMTATGRDLRAIYAYILRDLGQRTEVTVDATVVGMPAPVALVE